ncbi:hypothetical protein GCM10007880_35390 [Mesorhizobium amorphae]|nr:hypothetical protein GCM10007880_35390 [Mesorhizobium amorphae]
MPAGSQALAASLTPPSSVASTKTLPFLDVAVWGAANLAKAIVGVEFIRCCFQGCWVPDNGFQECATFGRFTAFGKTLAEIAAYMRASITIGFAAA